MQTQPNLLLGIEGGAAEEGGKKRRTVDRRGARSTSKYRGVTHHCRTGRWEAHLWQHGKQVYLGGFSDEPQAALAYDIAAIKARGRVRQCLQADLSATALIRPILRQDAVTNFPVQNYGQELANLERVWL